MISARAVIRRVGTTCRAPAVGAALLAMPFAAPRAFSQEPAAWTYPLTFSTFSIAAIDPRTGESGVAVTTRVPCVGNGVPWVRAGVGAVATQANTRTEYGAGLLDLLATGLSPDSLSQRNRLVSNEYASEPAIMPTVEAIPKVTIRDLSLHNISNSRL